MNLKARLLRWWDALLGRPPWYRDANVTISRTNLYRDGGPKQPADPEPDGLSLLDDDASGDDGRRRRHNTGVNPYSNDAGFTKPHGWDRDGRG